MSEQDPQDTDDIGEVVERANPVCPHCGYPILAGPVVCDKCGIKRHGDCYLEDKRCPRMYCDKSYRRLHPAMSFAPHPPTESTEEPPGRRPYIQAAIVAIGFSLVSYIINNSGDTSSTYAPKKQPSTYSEQPKVYGPSVPPQMLEKKKGQ